MTSLLTPETSTLLTLVFYTAGGIAGIAGMLSRKRPVRLAGACLAVLGFLAQTLFLFLGFHMQMQGGLSVGAYLQMLAWFLVLSGAGIWIVLRQEVPLLFAATLSVLLYGLSAPTLTAVITLPGMLNGTFYVLHIGSLFLSLALIATAALAGFVFLAFENRIKHKRPLPAFMRDMPALDLLDRVNAVGTLAGFPLYTMGIACGLFYAPPVFGSTITGDPKEVVSLFIWAVFAVLFHNRLARGWRGRKAAQLIILVFSLCLFSIVVVNLFMNSRHAFLL